MHRATVVNVDRIDRVSRDTVGGTSIRLKGRPETLALSKACQHLFRGL